MLLTRVSVIRPRGGVGCGSLDTMIQDHTNEWYYCLTHKAVEPYGACKAGDRLGPYASADEAAAALDRAAERNEDWQTDPRFNDPDEDEDKDKGAGDEDDAEGGWGPFRF